MNSKHQNFVDFDRGYRRALDPINTAYGPAWYQIRGSLAWCRAQYQWAITRNASRATKLELIGQITGLQRQQERHPIPVR